MTKKTPDAFEIAPGVTFQPDSVYVHAPATFRAVCNGCGSQGWSCLFYPTADLHCPACGRVMDILDEDAYSAWIEARASQIAYQRSTNERLTIAEWNGHVAGGEPTTRASAQGDTSAVELHTYCWQCGISRKHVIKPKSFVVWECRACTHTNVVIPR